MRRMAIGWLFTMLVAGTLITGARAEDSNVPLESLSWIIGQWEGEFILPEGVPEIGPAGSTVKHVETWRWLMGKKFIALSIRDEIGGKVVSTGHEYIGVDPGTGKLAHWFFGSAGGRGQGHWTRQEDCWMLHWQGFDARGDRVAGTSDQIRIDADTYIWHMRDIAVDGQRVPDWPKVTLVRKKSAAMGDDALWQAYRDASEGSWVGHGTLGRDLPELGLAQGDNFEYRLTWKSDLGGKAQLGSGPFHIAAKDYTAEARALTGWDPATGRVRLLAFWSGGLVEEILLSHQQGNAFVGTYLVAVPGAESTRDPIRIEFPDADHYVVKFVGGPRKGEVLCSFTRASAGQEH